MVNKDEYIDVVCAIFFLNSRFTDPTADFLCIYTAAVTAREHGSSSAARSSAAAERAAETVAATTTAADVIIPASRITADQQHTSTSHSQSDAYAVVQSNCYHRR